LEGSPKFFSKVQNTIFTTISSQIENAERKNVRSQPRPVTDYEDALDMYADDFDEKEKARMEKQAERKKEKGEEATSTESGKTEIGEVPGNGNVEMSEKSTGNVCSSSICILKCVLTCLIPLMVVLWVFTCCSILHLFRRCGRVYCLFFQGR
jgi:hypothetical protein